MVHTSSHIGFDPLDTDTWPSMLSITQVSKVLGIHITTIRRWDETKRWKATRFGPRGDRRYPKEDVIRVLTRGV